MWAPPPSGQPPDSIAKGHVPVKDKATRLANLKSRLPTRDVADIIWDAHVVGSFGTDAIGPKEATIWATSL